MGDIATRLQQVRRRIVEAARRTNRDPGSIELVAVSKTKPVEVIREAADAGAAAIGENYVQELVRKREEIGDCVGWHFIGHLQTNKAKYLVPFCTLIHGVDSVKLAAEISKRAARHGRVQRILIEVNLAEEESKFGVDETGAIDLAKAALELPNVELRGLMTMPPYPDDPEESRPHFVRLRRLQEELTRQGIPSESCVELSMGMTADFEVAIEEGATIVRVGTAIFGARDTAAS